jgi:hypothetical protein
MLEDAMGSLGEAKWGLIAVPLVAVSLLGTPTPRLNLALGVLLAGLLVFLRWRGMGWGRGVPLGLSVAVLPLVVPIAVRLEGTCVATGAACATDCLLACVVASLGTGMLLGAYLLRRRAGTDLVVGAALVASLGGALGCTAGGVAGVGVLLVVLASVTAGAIVFRPGLEIS